jgi:hypothetical protein
MNTKERWEEVQELLYSLAVRVTRVYQHYNEGCSLRFDIPITGTWIVAKERRNEARRDWLQYKGKLYDPAYIYTVHYSDYSSAAQCLKLLCPLEPWQGMEEQFGEEIGNLQLLAERRFNQDMLSRQGWFEIDFGRMQHIQRIYTRGGQPSRHHHLCRFPGGQHYKHIPGQDKRRLRKIRKGKKPKYVLVLDNYSPFPGMVNSYKISYKDEASGKWIVSHENILGNQDNLNTQTIEVNITARHIRIYPLTWKHSPAMNLRFYGTTSNTDNTAEASAEVLKNCIQYELIPAQTHGYRAVGGGFGGRERRYLRKQDRNGNRRMILQNMKSEYDDILNGYYGALSDED